MHQRNLSFQLIVCKTVAYSVIPKILMWSIRFAKDFLAQGIVLESYFEELKFDAHGAYM